MNQNTEHGIPLSLEGIGQIGIAVSDLDRAKAFYRNVLGVPFLFSDRRHTSPTIIWSHGVDQSQTVQRVVLARSVTPQTMLGIGAGA